MLAIYHFRGNFIEESMLERLSRGLGRNTCLKMTGFRNQVLCSNDGRRHVEGGCGLLMTLIRRKRLGRIDTRSWASGNLEVDLEASVVGESSHLLCHRIAGRFCFQSRDQCNCSAGWRRSKLIEYTGISSIQIDIGYLMVSQCHSASAEDADGTIELK